MKLRAPVLVLAALCGCVPAAVAGTAPLHWLYTRGTLVGWALVAFGGIVGALSASAATVLRARRQARNARKALGRVSDTIANTQTSGRVVVRGILAETEGGIVVRLRDGEVRLEGALVPVAGAPPGRFGKRVRVAGTLTQEAGESAPAGYRSATLRPKIMGTTLVAGERGPFLVRPRARWLAAGVAAGALLGAASLSLAAQSALALGETREDSGREVSPTALAAAWPWTRTLALRQLVRNFSEGVQTDERLESREAADLLLGECQEAISAWWAAKRYERAAALAARCHTRMDGTSFFRLGEFALASDAFAEEPGTLTVCAAHVAAHKYARAAAAVRSLAKAAQGDRAQALGCIADALAVRDGDADARSRLAAAAKERAMCRVLYADVLGPGAERLALLDDWQNAWAWTDNQGMDFTKGRVVLTANRLKEEVTGPLAPAMYNYTLAPSAAWQSGSWESEHRSDVPIALLYRLKDARAAPSEGAAEYRMSVAGNLALFDARLGEHGTAERDLAAVEDLRQSDYTYAEVEQVLARLRANPTLATRWSGTEAPRCAQCGLYVAMDDVATRRNEARERGNTAAEAELGAIVRRFRDAAIDPQNAVPLHMLEAFNLP